MGTLLGKTRRDGVTQVRSETRHLVLLNRGPRRKVECKTIKQLCHRPGTWTVLEATGSRGGSSKLGRPGPEPALGDEKAAVSRLLAVVPACTHEGRKERKGLGTYRRKKGESRTPRTKERE